MEDRPPRRPRRTVAAPEPRAPGLPLRESTPGPGTAVGAIDGDPVIATVIDGRYRIERLMGSGGMSRVYLGTSVKTGVQLAIKLIDLQLSGDPAMQQRILGEARAMMSLQSNHIVHALDVGSLASGQLYIVMEFLDGEDLDALLVREGPLPWARVADIGAQICSGLATAHRRGIVHRDIKPQNCIRVTVDDNPEHIKIIDFGVARDLEAAAGPTLQGFLVGTPEYMAPELLQRGVRAEPRTDIYALGATLYKLLTGVVPYRGANALATLDMHATSPLIPPSKRAPEFEIPPEADEIIGRALAKTLETRYGSADELARALRSALGVQRSGLLRRPEGSAIAAVERPATTPPVAAAPGRPGEGWRPVDALQAAAAGPRDASAVVSEASLHASTVPWRAARAEARPGETPATGTRPDAAQAAPPAPAVAHPPADKPEDKPEVVRPAPARVAPRRIDWRIQLLRATSLISLTLLFAIGTRLIAPVTTSAPIVVARDGPATAPIGETPKVSDPAPPPPTPAPRGSPAEISPVEITPPPEPPPAPTDAPPSADAGGTPPVELPPAPPQPVNVEPVAEAPTQPEPNFPYAEAKKIIDEQEKYLRTACMAKAAKPTNRLKLRVDVRPSGRPSVRVFWSTDKAVRTCVRNAFSFMFDPTPRGGAFEYVLTESGGSTLHKVPLEAAPGK